MKNKTWGQEKKSKNKRNGKPVKNLNEAGLAGI